ncbi:MAG TPA: protein TolQ [Gammaproteobacteria bacterium]|nr:protein TolQ [Gammaproteobacteria bacterium]
MSTDLSLVHLIMGASPVVQLVMLLLLTVSVISWTMIFNKSSDLKAARSEAGVFERRFWSGTDLGALYKEVSAHRGQPRGLASIFEAGFKEFARLRKQEGVGPITVVEGAQRSMRVALSREIEALETHLSFLATVGSVSPYVGLFGTVWGIMSAFRALGDVHQATLGMVAPGIAEALVATAMGLFAAIPAVIGYNRYANDVERLITHYDNFLEEFVSILQRQAHVPGTER